MGNLQFEIEEEIINEYILVREERERELQLFFELQKFIFFLNFKNPTFFVDF